MGTPGHRSRTSGCLCSGQLLFEVCALLREVYHFVVILCSESGLDTEKAIRITCAWLYASGRRRS